MIEKVDMRYLSADEIELLRKQVLRQRSTGVSNAEVSKNTGINQYTTSKIWNSYLRIGEASIKVQKSGRKVGLAGNKLTAEQEAEIRNVILSQPPHTVGLVGDLWTRQCIVEYIKKKYNVEYKIDSISKLTKKWGLSSQRPVKRAYKQDEKK
jgi:transposase